jgi:RHH-type transcriptional regulator, proline utilization regulon repressor / proline dehydrogenase / delta 1-pyrroline-5-carboxylate dehydrogenase
MSIPDVASSQQSGDVAADAVATVRRWLDESSQSVVDPNAKRLAGLLRDPRGLEFTLGFVDGVMRPEDLRVAARNLEKLGSKIPRFLPWYLRAVILIGAGFATLFPRPIIPIARRVFRRMVGHLILDGTPLNPSQDETADGTAVDNAGRRGWLRGGRFRRGTKDAFAETIVKLRTNRVRLNLNLLGEAVLGDAEADRRLAGTSALLARDDVDYVSIKVSSVASQLSMWAFEETVDRVVARLLPLYEFAAASPTTKFINLDMEEYRDLDLTIAVFTRLLEKRSLQRLEAGIVLQAYLPDALEALRGLTAWATGRRAAGGAGIKVRLVKGANLAMEHVDAIVHGWPVATYSSKRETDTNYKRLLDFALVPQHTDAVRIGVAGHNLFDIAFAWHLARLRKVENRVDFEMLLGMASAQAEAVSRDVGGILLYAPVVHPSEFDSAINYLVRRLEENSSSDNFMSAVFELAENEELFERERDRFYASLEALDHELPQATTVAASGGRANRVQDRSQPAVPARANPLVFHNEPDTDPAVAANRAWGRRVLEASSRSSLGSTTIAAAEVADFNTMAQRIASTGRAADAWEASGAEHRARVLLGVADVLVVLRGRLIEIMANETGKTITEADVEVSEAIDFARYYAAAALELENVRGARFIPPRLVVVAPPWNFPIAIPAGSVLAALSVGSSVILKPAPQARRCAAVLAEAFWEAGIPRGVLTLVDVAEGDVSRALIAHPAVERVILTGAWETANLFRSWRPDLPLNAETSGKNAIIVTPSADVDLAVADIVKSAFGHAGQKCSAASLVILVGSVGESERFRRQLVDAVKSLKVGPPQDPLSQVGPVILAASGKLLDALTTLADGESWLVKPHQLDVNGFLWSPGVRDGVVAGSAFQRTEYFGPVLGIMTAADLDEAIDLQNDSDYGLTAGIHSLNSAEVADWLERVEAGNLYVNRAITGAVVRRQPFGGWKRSAVGTGTKPGGPNYLISLGKWAAIEPQLSEDLRFDGLSPKVSSVIKKAQSGISFAEFSRLRAAAISDEEAWGTEFGESRDVSGLEVERNILRYRPVPVTIRLSEGAPLGHLLRLVAAAARTRAPIRITSAVPLPAALVHDFGGTLAPVIVRDLLIESDASWLIRAAQGLVTTPRIRLIGGDSLALSVALKGSPDFAIYDGDVTTEGRIELLTFLREQSVSITAHRFGNPDRSMIGLPL